jgi:hypothetical protein
MDGSVRLWDLLSAKEIGRFSGHRGWVLSVAFSSDGTRLVSGGLDTTALVWDVRPFLRRAGAAADRTEAELQSCWDDLAGDASAGYRAVGRLVASPNQALALLRRQLKPATEPNAGRIARLLEDLGSDRYATREQATRELEKLGEEIAPALARALGGQPSLEMRRRLEGLCDRLARAALTPEALRQVRAIEALERIGSAEACGQLEALANGAAGARPTQEARAALQRLNSRLKS